VGNREVEDPVSVGERPVEAACPAAATRVERLVPRAKIPAAQAASPAAKRGGGKGGKAGGAGGKAGGKGEGGKAVGTGKGGTGRRRGRFAWRRGRQGPAARATRVGGAGGSPCGASAKPGGYIRRRQGLTPRYTRMVDPAAMAVDGGNANGEAHVTHAVSGDGPDVDRSTDPEMLCQFRPSGFFYAHVGPNEVLDGIPVIADQSLYDVCVRNRARAHTRRIHARCEALPGFIDVLADPGTPSHAVDRVAEVHGDPFFGNQGPQRRIYEVMSFCNGSFGTKCRCTGFTAWCIPTLCCFP